ncbi:6-phosphogluconolactonase (cycloisomerase 2 family) [Micromonospora violae]|uniref:6-phosphogluconolactonase (Cycloisomerase 2 family) n=1 Tax=Micromonospora violae TaxID=1278207 RepID=A0A4Q7UFB6_9ACTN|nr:beta-propeller fold lactonase family protein [Micromonospora violae]RZT78998.1 6-phosphogluconolactonase (cycloisomerase 2 family) [Micromonospora violae]
MKRSVAFAAALLAGLTSIGSIPGTALADGGGPGYHDDRKGGDHHHGDEGAVFVQTNKAEGNTIKVYDRDEDGRLTKAGEYETGGLGGFTIGAPLDALASQGSLTYHKGLLFAVNAGSNTVTVFRVDGTRLHKLQVIWSGGLLPVSVAARGDLVYVLNAGGEGSVQGFELHKGRLSRIADANRSLGLHNGNPPAFGTAPAQVKIDPDSEFVLVSTKAANVMFSYEIGRHGQLSRNPVISDAGNTPFGFTFDTDDTLLVAESGSNSVSRFELEDDGALDQIGPSVPNGQQATCWIQRVGDFFYVANAGTSTISSYRVNDHGKLELVEGVAADTGGGSIDMTASDGFLYVQNATAGNVQGYEVGKDGSLKLVTTVEGLPKFADSIGMEGIAAS